MQIQMNSTSSLIVENRSTKNSHATDANRTNKDGSNSFLSAFRQKQIENDRVSKENNNRTAEESKMPEKQKEKAVEQFKNNQDDDNRPLDEAKNNSCEELVEVDSEEISVDIYEGIEICTNQQTILNLEILLTNLEELLGSSVQTKDIKEAIVEMKLLLEGLSKATETELITINNQLSKLMDKIEANIDMSNLFIKTEHAFSSESSGAEKFNQIIKELDILLQKFNKSLNNEKSNFSMVRPEAIENAETNEMIKNIQDVASTDKIEVLVSNEQSKISSIVNAEKENFSASSDTTQEDSIVIDNLILRDKPTAFTKVDLNTQKNSSTLETKQILEQIVEKAHVNITNNKNEMLIKLTPERLGNVSVNITIEKGLVNATLYAENYQVKEMLENNLDQLRTILIEKGLGIESLNVSVGQYQEQLNKFRHSAFNQNGKKNNKNAGVDVIHQSTIYDDNMINHNPYIKATQFDMLA